MRGHIAALLSLSEEVTNPNYEPRVGLVRPSVRERAEEQTELSRVAKSAALISDTEGTTFEVVLQDDVLQDTVCRVSLKDGRVEAVFTADSQEAQRLLEARLPELRQRLESKGFRGCIVRLTRS